MVEQSVYKLCECGCGKELPFNNKRKYFSSACRQKAYRDFKAKRAAQPDDPETSRERAIQTKRDSVKSGLCRQCNEYFPIDGTQRKKEFCSKACRQAHYRARKAWIESYEDKPQAIISVEPTIAVIIAGSENPQGDLQNMLLAAYDEQEFDNA